MVKQQTEPDIDSWAEQERRIRSSARKQKIGAFALVAAMAVAAIVFLARNPSEEQDRFVPADPGTETAAPPANMDGFARFDIATGEIRSTGITGSSSAVDVSPDATRITYVDTMGGSSAVYVANIDGSDPQVFPRTGTFGEPNAPHWSPDGTKIVFQSRPTGDAIEDEIGNLFILDLATGRVERITNLGALEAGLWWMAPTFSADGQTVLFNKPRHAGIGASDAGQRWDVWSVPVSGGEPTLVRENAFAVDVSPNGAKIAYTEVVRSEDGFQTGDVYIANLDGSDALKIATGPADFARWSPDGSQLAFNAQPSGEIVIVDVETGDTRFSGAYGWPEWADADTLMIEVGVA